MELRHYNIANWLVWYYYWKFCVSVRRTEQTLHIFCLQNVNDNFSSQLFRYRIGRYYGWRVHFMSKCVRLIVSWINFVSANSSNYVTTCHSQLRKCFALIWFKFLSALEHQAKRLTRIWCYISVEPSPSLRCFRYHIPHIHARIEITNYSLESLSFIPSEISCREITYPLPLSELSYKLNILAFHKQKNFTKFLSTCKIIVLIKLYG